MKPIRYDETEITNYIDSGHWERATLSDYWNLNAAKWPDKEALAKIITDKLEGERQAIVENG